MKKKIENYKRRDLFRHYDTKTNPFAIITTKIDVTNIYELSKQKGRFYPLMGYYLTKSMCEVEEFRYTYEDGEFYLSDTIVPSFTEMKSDETIGFFDVPLTDTYEEYIASYDHIKANFLSGKVEPETTEAAVWLSCEPWFKASSIIPPLDKEIRIPQMIWDKYEIIDGRCYVNLMILFHHGLADGYHIGKLIQAIEKNIAEITL